ncbi:MAG TPA: diguanylate cyclase [Solirubrobacteraceae bacterium]|jgi:GGDEF domain-containing protein|nr:diguanylate cyclase [Solirubrobacteraceae bacterium]
MAASDQDTKSERPEAGAVACLSESALRKRLAEEVNRAGRHGTPLSCLIVTIGNLEELVREHGGDLYEETLFYVARALGSQVRDFDRIGMPADGELLLLLPGADGPRGEIVARRALARLRAIKVESDGERRPLSVSVGLAAWREGLEGAELLELARAAARRAVGNGGDAGLASASPPALGRPPGPA